MIIKASFTPELVVLPRTSRVKHNRMHTASVVAVLLVAIVGLSTAVSVRETGVRTAQN